MERIVNTNRRTEMTLGVHLVYVLNNSPTKFGRDLLRQDFLRLDYLLPKFWFVFHNGLAIPYSEPLYLCSAIDSVLSLSPD